MDEHYATELAYKNGYKKGVADAVRKMQNKLTNRYEFNCNVDVCESNVLYYSDLCEWVERIANELLEKNDG